MTIDRRVSELSGELVAAPDAASVIEVPFAPGFDLEKLRTVDPDPRFAVVKVKPGRGQGGKGPNYGPNVLRDLARQINEKRPSGYKGHQDESRVHYEWREPVTAWVGAFFDEQEQVLYVKGYVPPTATDLRTQLSLAESGADVVNSVSIWGMRDVRGDEVIAYDLWSLDWTPKGRAGMETELVSVTGEQRGDDVDRSEVIASLKVEEIPDPLKEHFREEGRQSVTPVDELVGEMRVILELDENADTSEIVRKVTELIEEDRNVEFQSRVEEKVNAEVAGELMKAAIVERVTSRLKPTASDEELTGEIEAAKELPHIKALSGQKIPTVVGGGQTPTERKGTAWSD